MASLRSKLANTLQQHRIGGQPQQQQQQQRMPLHFPPGPQQQQQQQQPPQQQGFRFTNPSLANRGSGPQYR
eukprot:13556-Heterococcus_DN1.PRE.2